VEGGYLVVNSFAGNLPEEKMRVLDKQGMLFGKINIIDFLVIVFVSFLSPIFFFSYKAFEKSRLAAIKEVGKKEFVYITLKCLFIKLDPRIAKDINLGDQEFDQDKKVVGEIIWLGRVSPYAYELEIGTKEKLTIYNYRFKQIPAVLHLRLEIRGNNIFYNGRQLLNKEPFEFKTDKYKVAVIPIFKDYNAREKLDHFLGQNKMKTGYN
jgi:hypothetical protein